MGKAYNFTLSGESAYKIAPRSNTFQIVDDSGSVSSIKTNTATHFSKLSGALAIARPVSPKGASRFNGCSSSQQKRIQIAASSANRYASSSLSCVFGIFYFNRALLKQSGRYLEETDGSTKRYGYWFGAYSLDRKNTVQSHFSRIASYDYTTDYAFDCTCDRAGTFAYVYPSEYVRLFLAFHCNTHAHG